MVSLENITVGYKSSPVVTDININVEPGKVVSLIGANGAGKTTVIKTVSGLLKPWSGAIHSDGKKVDHLSPADIVKNGIAVVPQGRRIFPGLTVLENLHMGAYLIKNKKIVSERLEEMFELFPILKDRRKQEGTTLSGGEQQMLAIARGLMSRPKYLFLDEPSIGLAPLIVERLFETIEGLTENGLGILLVEQNARLALGVSQFVSVLEGGKIVLSGTAKELENHELLNSSYLGSIAN